MLQNTTSASTQHQFRYVRTVRCARYVALIFLSVERYL